MSIEVGILGYGNVGRGVEYAFGQNPDMHLAAVFTRRDPATVSVETAGVAVVSTEDIAAWTDKIDVLILCGGSATDLPKQTPQFTALFNTVDSFDTHANIPAHFAAVDAVARQAGKISVISCGWDPGMFSLARFYGDAVLPVGKSYTFWGKGISQGHSDAIRRIEGVLDARQYTVPVAEALAAVQRGECPELTTAQKHERECFVVAKPGADLEKIRESIVTMPNYFADYHTTVHFITEEELLRDHGEFPHGGAVIRSGVTGKDGEHRHTVEYKLTLDSNPEFTGSILLACARAAVRMQQEGQSGCRTLLDIPPVYLSARSREQLLKEFV